LLVSSWTDGIQLYTQNGEKDQRLSPPAGADAEWIHNGTQIIAEDNTQGGLKIWSPEGIQHQEMAAIYTSFMTDFAVHPDESMIAVADRDTSVSLWSIDGILIKKLEGHNGVNDVDWTPDGSILASAGSYRDGTIKLWDKGGTLLTSVQAYKDVTYGLAWSPDGQILASVGDTGLKFWRRDGTLITASEYYSIGSNPLTWSPDGSMLALCVGEQVVIVDKNGTELARVGNSSQWFYDIDWRPDGRMLSTVTSDGSIQLWATTP
jgi:WD40 repeat protein